jgi:hypothetical protein
MLPLSLRKSAFVHPPTTQGPVELEPKLAGFLPYLFEKRHIPGVD